jgi:hypothetical protein
MTDRGRAGDQLPNAACLRRRHDARGNEVQAAPGRCRERGPEAWIRFDQKDLAGRSFDADVDMHDAVIGTGTAQRFRRLRQIRVRHKIDSRSIELLDRECGQPAVKRQQTEAHILSIDIALGDEHSGNRHCRGRTARDGPCSRRS